MLRDSGCAVSSTRVGEVLARKMIDVRRAIHRNPELSHNERETSALVRAELQAAGITEIQPVFEAGLVATIRGSRSGRTLVLRADMDALPIREACRFDFASGKDGVMHACGHDVHTAILLGVALALNARKDSFAGCVRCIFQPAEEAEPLGGREVVRAGHLADVDAALALHVDPDIAVGAIGIRAGPVLAGGSEFTITVEGLSSHAARPHLGTDAISVAAAIVQELQKVTSRRLNPFEPVVVTIGRIQGGAAKNIICDRVVLEGTYRVLNEDLRAKVLADITAIATSVAAAHGARVEVEASEGEPVLTNDETLARVIRAAAEHLLGTENVHTPVQSLGSEDFAFYAKAVPSAMFRLGVRNEREGIVYPLHHPEFAVDERALPVGASVMLETAERLLAGDG